MALPHPLTLTNISDKYILANSSMISRRLDSSDLFMSSWEVCRDTTSPGEPLGSSLSTPGLVAREECAARMVCTQEPMHVCSVPTLPNWCPGGHWCPAAGSQDSPENEFKYPGGC